MAGEARCFIDDFKEEGFEGRKEGYKEMVATVDKCVANGGNFLVSFISLNNLYYCRHAL